MTIALNKQVATSSDYPFLKLFHWKKNNHIRIDNVNFKCHPDILNRKRNRSRSKRGCSSNSKVANCSTRRFNALALSNNLTVGSLLYLPGTTFTGAYHNAVKFSSKLLRWFRGDCRMNKRNVLNFSCKAADLICSMVEIVEHPWSLKPGELESLIPSWFFI